MCKLIILLFSCIFWSLVSALEPWEPEPHSTLSGWDHKHEALVNETVAHAADIKAFFIGDSITEQWLSGHGKKIWNEHYANRGAYNYGIGSDMTQHVLWRLEREFTGVKPKLVTMMIGNNNLRHTNATALQVAKGIQAILDLLATHFPDAKVLLLSILPAEVNYETKITDTNKLIARFADNRRVHYLDLAVHYEIAPGEEKAELYGPDHVHLTEKGYDLWYRIMEPSFKQLIV